MIAGTYVLTDQMRSGVRRHPEPVARRAWTWSSSPREAFGSDFSASEARRCDDALVDRLGEVPGVADASRAKLSELGAGWSSAARSSSTGGAPSVRPGRRAGALPSRCEDVAGRAPARAGRGRRSCSKRPSDQDLTVGDRVGLTTRLGVRRCPRHRVCSPSARVARRWAAPRSWSIAKARASSAGSTWRAGSPASSAVGSAGRNAGASWCERSATSLPAGLEVQTARARTPRRRADEINDQIGGFLTPALLLVFAGAALLVGAFIIFNTFSITVAQRAREFALLRSLGATRAQVLRAVAVGGARHRRRGASVLGYGSPGFGIAASARGALFDGRRSRPAP